MRNTQLFHAPCHRCGNMFQKIGKDNKICDDCNITKKNNLKRKEKLKEEYFQKKEELNKIRDNATLENYKILDAAYTIGKKLWGTHFTIVRLAYDMDMPYTTVHRCLSLRKAHPISWALVKENKLSVFKLAMICSLKSKAYQDEIVKMVIEDNLSTCQIKGIKINNIEDVNKERHRLAIEKGYSRKDSAYTHFNHWMERGKIFLLMDVNKLPKNKIETIKQNLKGLNKNIKTYINEKLLLAN